MSLNEFNTVMFPSGRRVFTNLPDVSAVQQHENSWVSLRDHPEFIVVELEPVHGSTWAAVAPVLESIWDRILSRPTLTDEERGRLCVEDYERRAKERLDNQAALDQDDIMSRLERQRPKRRKTYVSPRRWVA